MDILNMSIGFQESVAPLEDILKTAEKKGMLLVAAAGNDGEKTPTENTIDYPGRYASTITVGAIDNNNKRADFNDKGDLGVGVESRSSTGSEIDVVAPGYGVASTYVDNQYAYMSGTSMAAPYVTGLLAVLKEAYPNATAKELRKILTDNAIDLGSVGKDSEYGYGLAQFVKDTANVLEVSSLKETHTDQTVTLSWKNPGQDFKEAKVYRNGTLLTKTNGMSYTDKNVSQNTSYSYKVTTLDTAGNESKGVTVSAKTSETTNTPTVPKQVTNVTTKTTENSVTISWELPKDDNFAGLLISRDGDLKFITSAEKSFTEKNLKPGTSYRYELISSDGNDNYSKPVVVNVKTATTKTTTTTTTNPTKDTTKLPFTDVKQNSWAYEDIRYVYNQKWMGGVDKTSTFKPTKSLTRAEAAAIFVRALGLKESTSIKKASFKDVSTKHWAFVEIEIAKQHGLFSGTDKNNFSPEKPITRREIAAVFNRVTNDGKSSINAKKMPFKDVTSNDWARLDIIAMTDKKILSGYPDGSFKPSNAITREEMAALMKRSEPFFKK